MKSMESEREKAAWMLRSCIAGRTRLLNRVVTSIYDEALRPHGLRNGQLTILCVVCYMNRVKPSELEKILQMDASTISRNLKRLRERGWLQAVPADDERTYFVKLRPQGRRQIEKALPAWEQAQERARLLLGREGAESLTHASELMLRAVIEEAPKPRS